MVQHSQVAEQPLRLLDFLHNATCTFTVTNANGCISPSSGNVVINAIPSLPVLGGATSVCVGSTANVTPSTNGTWTSGNGGIATVSNSGLVTGIAAGTVTLTYTRTSDGCSNSTPVTVNSNPTIPVVGTITQPTCSVSGGSVVLSGLPSSGTWTITRTPGGATNTGTGTSFTVTSLPANANYTFTVSNTNGCTSGSSSTAAINAVPGAPVISGPSFVCVGLTANVTPSTNGTWVSSNNSIASITNTGLVTSVAPGSVTLTYTRTSDGCSNTLPFSVISYPSMPVIGTITQPNCAITTGRVVLNGLPSSGTWTITQNPGGNTFSGTGTSYTVTGLAQNTTYTFIVANQQNCASPSSNNVVIPLLRCLLPLILTTWDPFV
ncbi:MAG: Ig-like domain-containing protein [Saprospiraceae bacterium]|nr:Ig-like domain-containing protein [Saprospiraceae bacterium]